MKRGVILIVAGMLGGLAASATAEEPAGTAVDVYKTPTCGCCSKWVAHLRQNGLTVRTTEISDHELGLFRVSHGVPWRMQSCHTALVAGYVVEGHVPATDVRRLTKERPAILGLAVAGMQLGSPGMETHGSKPRPYDVMAFDKQGNTRVFATYTP